MTRHLNDAERWKKIVQSFSDVSITALVDLVADEFVFGEIARVSREAPVLILKHRERTVLPGGGGQCGDEPGFAGCQCPSGRRRWR